jgi:uncharacterized protein (DUF427 family)
MKRIEPGPGQESVWNYPRPPRLERCPKKIEVKFGGVIVAASTRTLRLLETSHPPAYYIPPEDTRWEYLSPGTGSSFCEFKGHAVYWNVRSGERIGQNVAWSYPAPAREYSALRDHLAFYAGRVDECFVDGHKVQPQPGGFYGGWITPDIIGPYKGGPGTLEL